MEPEPLIPKHGGYRKLKSFQIAQLCYDVTVYHDPTLAEDRLTDSLCGYLEAATPTELPLLRFTFQQPLDGRRSADMGVRPRPWQGITIDQRNVSIDDPVAVIEAKRLPTPGTNRTREYVIDDRLDDRQRTIGGGGVERFKENHHGNGEVEIDNNWVENAIRPTAIGKKNWLFIGHPNAGQQSAILYTIIENCRLNDIDPVEYLEDVLPRIQDHPKARVCELLPRQWKAAREQRAA